MQWVEDPHCTKIQNNEDNKNSFPMYDIAGKISDKSKKRPALHSAEVECAK